MPDLLRERFLRGVVLFGVALLLITEALSAFDALTRWPLIAAWLLVIAVAVFYRPFRITWPALTCDPVVILCAGGIAVILALTGITTAYSPPNSADAMAYHMPRVIYWAEQASVRFFPTPYLNQIMLQALAEYAMLQTYIISGGDRFINFVQWFASAGCMIGVSSVARCLGAKQRGQWLAALFCATLPSGILASSGAKNDYFLAMWLVAAVFFAFRLVETARWMDAALLGAACGLALYTKATAYLFAPCLLAAVLANAPRRVIRLVIASAFLTLVINIPQYIRNYNLSGSVLGFDSAQGDGVYRWRNQSLGWKPTVSNLLRNTSEQLGARSERWNTFVYSVVTGTHAVLGLNINDPATTWPGSTYRPPRNANHEADAPNRLAFLILTAAGLLFLIRRQRARTLYALSILAAFIAFCAYLKWQPFMARLILPLFVLGSPLAGLIGESIAPALLQIALCLLLLDAARLPLLENWTRPLRGPNSVLHASRDTQYFADMKQWDNRAAYYQAVRELSKAKCGVIGLDINNLQLEYPLQALLREQNPHVQFLHTDVRNTSSRYAQPVSAQPCAIVRLNGSDRFAVVNAP